MTHIFSIRFLFVLVVGLYVSGCNQLECGAGTYESLGTCVASAQTLCGDGTVYERGYCVLQDGDTQIGPSPADVNDDIRDVERIAE